MTAAAMVGPSSFEDSPRAMIRIATMTVTIPAAFPVKADWRPFQELVKDLLKFVKITRAARI